MNLCTYFNKNYILKGLVCLHTINKLSPNSKVYVLCLDNEVFNLLNNKGIDNVILIKLSEIESYCPELLKAKTNRTLFGYYGTMSPILPLYIFDHYNVDVLFYTDSDMAFWSDPEEMLKVFGDKSIMVTDHGFEPPRNNIRFNVGILGYRNDDNCKEFLQWWKDKCIDWCEWATLPDGRCGDQGYLNIIRNEPNKFKNTLECPHPGINLAPWNIAKHKVTKPYGILVVDGKWNLICYHYHEYRFLSKQSYFPTNWSITKDDKKFIYDPYFEIMCKFA